MIISKLFIHLLYISILFRIHKHCFIAAFYHKHRRIAIPYKKHTFTICPALIIAYIIFVSRASISSCKVILRHLIKKLHFLYVIYIYTTFITSSCCHKCIICYINIHLYMYKWNKYRHSKYA